jgi:hypothetical protein
MNWESTMLLNVVSDLPNFFCNSILNSHSLYVHLYHRDTEHHFLGASSLKWKVQPLLQYHYNYCKNCYMLLQQQLNDLNQLFDAMACACSRSHTCFTALKETSLNAETKIISGYCLCCSILPWGSFVFICTPCPHSKYITFKLKEIINIGIQ